MSVLVSGYTPFTVEQGYDANYIGNTLVQALRNAGFNVTVMNVFPVGISYAQGLTNIVFQFQLDGVSAQSENDRSGLADVLLSVLSSTGFVQSISSIQDNAQGGLGAGLNIGNNTVRGGLNAGLNIGGGTRQAPTTPNNPTGAVITAQAGSGSTTGSIASIVLIVGAGLALVLLARRD